MADESREMDLLVRSVRLEAENVIVIEFVDPAGGELPDWTPGSHLEVVLPSGLIRHYSLSGPAKGHTSYEVAVLRVADGRGGSIELHDAGLVGRRLTVRGPRNRFPLELGAPAHVLIAGGIGVTPLLPMARALSASQRRFRLVYGARSAGALAFASELSTLSGADLDLVDESITGRPDLLRVIAEAPDGALVYCCGPEPMIAAVETLVAAEDGRIALRVERFAASGDVEAVREGDTTFEIVLKRSGAVLTVPPDRTALDVVREYVPGHPYSCLEGECGSCEVAVLEGQVDHRDQVLSDDEREQNSAMMLCVSRALSSRLVIDL